MFERRWEELVRIFTKKGLAGIMESQARKTTGENAPMSLMLLRLSIKVLVQPKT